MLALRKSDERGHADHGWLNSYHSFSFADYYDPRFMGFRSLRVINEDRVQPGMGFGTHGHRDMEIVSYVLDGDLEHRDSMDNGSVIRAGDVQRMSAGTGVRHSEFNPSKDNLVHFLQIWIEPNVIGIKPEYEEKTLGIEGRRGRLQVVASPDGRDGSMTIHADVVIYAALLDEAESIEYALPVERSAYVHVARGAITVNGQQLNTGDAVAITDEKQVKLENGKQAEIIVFDLN